MSDMLREGANINGEPFTEQAFVNLLIQLGHIYYEDDKEGDEK